MKRLIGRRFVDAVTQANIKHFPFQVKDFDGNMKIKIKRKQNIEFYYPEEISAMILEKLKENAERYLKTNVQKAVITVPAHFNDSQRQATKDAGIIAGLNVLRIINEPTAAILAYGIDKKYKNQKMECNVLVYNFGGGTFDVSIITVNNGIFEVKATDGDTNMGGDDMDLRLLNHLVNEFKRQYGKDLRTDKRALRRLLVQCEKLKITLSSADGAIIEIDSLMDDCDLRSTIMTTDFETMCSDIFAKTLKYVKNVLKEANMSVSDIQEVVLVGGSTRIPKVQKMVKDYFGGKELNTSLNPDEAVAIGASVQAAILAGDNSDVISGLLLMDVNPFSLGVELTGERMFIIIPRNKQIPVKFSKIFYNIYDYATFLDILVYEGEHTDVRHNYLLGEITLTGLTRRRAGKNKILITFDLNTDGILHVTATEIGKGKYNAKSVNIVCDKSRLSEYEIERIIDQAVKLKEEDARWAKNVAARLKLEDYCNRISHRVNDFAGTISNEHRQTVEMKCKSVLKWMSENMDQQEAVYEMKEKEVYIVCNPIIRQYL